MPVTERDGAELYWEREGAGPALVLGAGLGGAASWWAPNRAALAERFSVITFDQRGTGRSSKVPVASIEQMAADLVAVLDAARLDAAHYLGHSTGGAIGVATALDHPGRLRSLLIYASTTHGDAYRRRVFALRERLLSELGAEAYAQYTSLLLYPPYWINANAERLAAMEKEAAAALGPAAVQASRLAAILEFDRRAELKKIRIPTLVLCADDDILTPRYFSEEYARLIPGAKTRWEPRGGHALSRTEPATFNRIALEFFTAGCWRS
jgi:aminoacrylate hydrolase